MNLDFRLLNFNTDPLKNRPTFYLDELREWVSWREWVARPENTLNLRSPMIAIFLIIQKGTTSKYKL